MSSIIKSVPLFDVNWHFVATKERARYIMVECGIDDATIEDLLQCRGFCHILNDTTGREVRMICVFDREDPVNTAIHEAVHAAWHTLRYCSVRTKGITDEEPMAYLTAWFGREMIRFLDMVDALDATSRS